MKVETHKQLRASMLCIIAFTIGCMVVFCGGCSTAGKTQTRVFDSQIEFGGGLYYKKPNLTGSSLPPPLLVVFRSF